MARKAQERVGDSELVAEIRQIIAERPFYGYRRVTAMINRARLRPVNPKRIYRLMAKYGLLLQKARAKPTRTHDGKIMTLSSNMRWCSDHFDIRCWNGDVVRVAFSLDTHDREVMAYRATTEGVTSVMIQDLIADTVDYRFGNVVQLPHKIQWLSDNGPAYTAKDTINFARLLGFEVCTTPAYCPESNGMAEAWVKTFKRDYVYVSDLPNAATVLLHLPIWIEDYNEVAPHKALKMRSPREHIRAKCEKLGVRENG